LEYPFFLRSGNGDFNGGGEALRVRTWTSWRERFDGARYQQNTEQEAFMRKALEIGGVVAAVVLIAFGAGAVVIGLQGRSTVSESLKEEHVEGQPEMTASRVAEEAKKNHITGLKLPTCSVAGETIDTGEKAYCFAQYMRAHAYIDTGGYTYSQLGRYEAEEGAPKGQLKEGGGTENMLYAVTDPSTGLPKTNPNRETWETEAALSTALNAAYMGEKTAQFGMVVGLALLLTGIGFLVLVASGVVAHSEPRLRLLRYLRSKFGEHGGSGPVTE
jgi:hypothetical protein